MIRPCRGLPNLEASPLSTLIALASARLRGRRAVLVAAALVLAVLAAATPLDWGPAIAGFVIIFAVALLVPSSGESAALDVPSTGGGSDDLAMRRFADALPDPCLILDRRGVVIHRNPLAAAQFPSTRDGAPLTLSLRQPAIVGAIDRALDTGTAQTVELHVTVPAESWHQVTVAPLEGDGPVVVTLRNLTEQKRIDELRRDFIANASHELRTPLTSLIGYVDTLLGPAANDPEARERFLGIMRGQGARMSKLIDDLLSLSRIEMRQHVRPTGAVDIAGLLRTVAEELGAQASEAEVTIELDLPAGETLVTGDRDELHEVFENLVDNAIKYGSGGGRVVVAVRPAGDIRYAWAVTVTDFGAGIPEEHVPRLTERFYRVDAESSRKKKGTGLGLAIAKHILNRHHGLMTIRSRPGQGTSVEVLLNR